VSISKGYQNRSNNTPTKSPKRKAGPSSFIPPRDIRELRDLTRRRRTLLSDGASERNRVQKILEDANVKIGDVLSNVFGMSGQAMLEALLENKRSATEIAELVHWRLAPKIPRIVEALEGHRMRDHHRLLIRQSLDLEQFHGDKRRAVVCADVVNDKNVRMIQRRRCPCLALESFQGLAVAREFVSKKLQSDLPSKTNVFRLVDHAHPAAAEPLDDSIMRNLLANHNCRPPIESGNRATFPRIDRDRY